MAEQYPKVVLPKSGDLIKPTFELGLLFSSEWKRLVSKFLFVSPVEPPDK